MKKARILAAAALLSAVILSGNTDAAAEEISQPPVRASRRHPEKY